MKSKKSGWLTPNEVATGRLVVNKFSLLYLRDRPSGWCLEKSSHTWLPSLREAVDPKGFTTHRHKNAGTEQY